MRIFKHNISKGETISMLWSCYEEITHNTNKKVYMQVSAGYRGRGRLLITWIKAVRKDLLNFEIVDGL